MILGPIAQAHLGRPAPDVEEDVRKVMSHFPAVLETVRITCDMLSNGKVDIILNGLFYVVHFNRLDT